MTTNELAMKLFSRNGLFIAAPSVKAAHRACERMGREPHPIAGLMPGAGRITLARTTPDAAMRALEADGYVGMCYVLTTDGVVHVLHTGDALPVAGPRDWAVVDMDGHIVGRYACAEAAAKAARQESAEYARGRDDRSYLPRSVCHLACGAPVRRGQYATTWAVGCEHEMPAYDVDGG